MLIVRNPRAHSEQSAAERQRISVGLVPATGALVCVLIGAAAVALPHANLEGRWYTINYVEGIEVDVPRADSETCEAIAAVDGSLCVFGSVIGGERMDLKR